MAHRLGHDPVEPSQFLERAIGERATPRHPAQQMSRDQGGAAENTMTRETSRGASWDFSQIPLSPPDRASRGASPQPIILQRKLMVGQPDDPLEHEADRIADQVMRMPAPEAAPTTAPPQVNHQCDPCEVEELQMKEARPQSAVEAPGSVHEVLGSPGQPLDAATRAYFDPRFGYDFSRVRVHRDDDATASARAMNARAYTVGTDVVFQTGEYTPQSSAGRRLLAHELTHVVQQSGGRAGLPIASSAFMVCRDQDTDKDPLNRPGAAWPYGPITKHKSKTTVLDTYLGWVKELEAYIGPDKQRVLQTLRRVYYSAYTPGLGAKFDQVIEKQRIVSGPPLDTRVMSLQAVDGLFETNVVALQDGDLLDVSHVLAGLDLAQSGTSFAGGGAEALYGTNMAGVLTWTGDLAMWLANAIQSQGADEDQGLRATHRFGPFLRAEGRSLERHGCANSGKGDCRAVVERTHQSRGAPGLGHDHREGALDARLGASEEIL